MCGDTQIMNSTYRTVELEVVIVVIAIFLCSAFSKFKKTTISTRQILRSSTVEFHLVKLDAEASILECGTVRVRPFQVLKFRLIITFSVVTEIIIITKESNSLPCRK